MDNVQYGIGAGKNCHIYFSFNK